MTLDWLARLTGNSLTMPTSSYSQYLAVALVAGLGVAGAFTCSQQLLPAAP